MRFACGTQLALSVSLALVSFSQTIVDRGPAARRWEGEIERLIADDVEHGTSREIYQLRQNGRAVRLELPGERPSCLPAGRFRISGVENGDRLIASSLELLAPLPVCAPTGEQKVAVLLFKFPSSAPQTATPDDVRAKFFSSSAPSLNTYWRETSGGRTWATGDVFGWYTLDRDYTCDQSDEILRAAIAKADNDANLTAFNRLFLVFPLPSGCGWAGLGTTACSTQISPKNGTFSASVVWMSASAGWGLPAHEGGHNLGIGHANIRQFSGQLLGAPGEAGNVQYMGDSASVMGNAGNDGHYSSRHKLRLGWLVKGTDIVDVEGEGTYTITPLAVAGGTKALRVRRGPGLDAWVWLEYRQPGAMFDRSLPAGMYGGALMHYEDQANAGTDYFDTHLLDSTPGSAGNSWSDMTDSPLTPGRRWTDSYGDLAIEVLSASPAGLTVQITRQPSCLSVAAVALRHSAAQEEGSVAITAQGSCSWTASTTASWIHLLAPVSGTGSGTLRYTVDANPGASPRTGEIRVGPRNVLVTQDYLRPAVSSLDPSSGQGSSATFRFKVTDPRGPQFIRQIYFYVWGDPQDSYVRLTGAGFSNAEVVGAGKYETGALGSTNKLVSPVFSLDLSRSSVQVQGSEINVSLAIEFSSAAQGTRTVEVWAVDTQGATSPHISGRWTVPSGAACSYKVYPAAIVLAPTGGIASIAIDAGAGCDWSATTSATWIGFSRSAGTGPATIQISAPAAAAARSAVVAVGGVNVAITQPSNSGGTLRFVPVVPCRVADTRSAYTASGPFGPPSMAANATREFRIPDSPCGVPATAKAYSLNVTVVPSGALYYLTLWPSGQPMPVVSTLNSFDGRVTANAAIVPAGANGGVSVFVTNNTDVIIDVNGYFVQAVQTGLPFYTIAPCRVLDTRAGYGFSGLLGPPSLNAAAGRDFPFTASGCGLPTGASAYSINATVVPPGPLAYLTLWPSGRAMPVVSTLNSFDGDVIANAALVPAGANGGVSAFVSDRTDLLVDVNGYFGQAGTTTPLSFVPVSPCRVADTRADSGFAGAFGPPSLAAGNTREFPVMLGACGIASSARAYSLNITAVPRGPLGFLTVWPTGQPRPNASTLNSWKGRVVANAAIVPGGSSVQFAPISVFASDATDVIIDINGYFVP